MSLSFDGVVFAFAAGALTFLSPCAFPMLPAYISYYLGIQQDTSVIKNRGNLVSRALPTAVVASLGFFSVFTIIGVLVSILGSLISQYIPIIEPIVGVILIGFGATTLLGHDFSFQIFTKTPQARGYTGIFVFGVLYALAAVGCTAPIFVSLLFYAFSLGGFLGSMSVFGIYSLGMVLLLTLVTFLIAGARETMLGRIRRAIPYTKRIGAIVLIAVGGYLIYFYATTYL